MNTFIENQINNMLLSLKNFEVGCKLAATKDDGSISREEEKQLKKIKKATDKYRKELETIK